MCVCACVHVIICSLPILYCITVRAQGMVSKIIICSPAAPAAKVVAQVVPWDAESSKVVVRLAPWAAEALP